ncbi:MAG: HAD-IIA family hydrolase [Nocardioides sp.]|nr:HAD-IIA family hydrolase [Nocardioides sp.]
MLGQTDRALWDLHDLAMLDLDGVVYIGTAAVPGAPEHLRVAREHDLRLAFVTNNASRPPSTVAAHLSELGVPAAGSDVVTSAQAAARVLLDELGSGARVVLLGALGLREALLEVGLEPVTVQDEAAAVVSGYGPDVLWSDIMRAAVRIRDGLWWVASNTDLTIPTAYGPAPGHGVLVDTLQRFTRVQPAVGGKPSRPLLDETIRRVGGERPLMVGDRLDTDILGGRNAEVPTLLVMTGVTGLAELVEAGPELRPTYVAADLGGLGTTHGTPEREHGVHALGGWRAGVEAGCLQVSGAGEIDDWWRVVATAGWAHLDACGRPVDVRGVRPPAPQGQGGSPLGSAS